MLRVWPTEVIVTCVWYSSQGDTFVRPSLVHQSKPGGGGFIKRPLLEFFYHKDLGSCSATIDHAF